MATPRSFVLGALALGTVACSSPELTPHAGAGGALSSASSNGAGGGSSTSGGGGEGAAGGAAARARGVMMQGFYWDVPPTDDGNWWKHLAAIAGELHDAGITAIWIPPPYKGKNGTSDVGYGVYDRYDLGEFDQKGTIATRYGTRAELEAAIEALHRSGIAVYADIVMNHLMGGDPETFTVDGKQFTASTSFTFPGRGGAYSTWTWNHDGFNGCKQGGGWTQWHPWDFQPYAGGDAWDGLLGCEIRYADAADRDEMITWGKWITSTLALDGYRLDATKHMLDEFVNDWLDAVKGDRFAVSEAWFGDLGHLEDYAVATGGRTSLFDVPLHYLLRDMGEGNGAWDMRKLAHAGFTDANGDLSVSFVDNHDTDNAGGLHSPVVNLKMLAYAYILTRDRGYPCVFYKDFYEYGFGDSIRKLIAIRSSNGYGEGAEHAESDTNVYVYSRAGDDTHPGLVLLLNDGPALTKTVTTPFPRTSLVDAIGNETETVETDASGQAALPIAAKSYGVWVPR